MKVDYLDREDMEAYDEYCQDEDDDEFEDDEVTESITR